MSPPQKKRVVGRRLPFENYTPLKRGRLYPLFQTETVLASGFTHSNLDGLFRKNTPNRGMNEPTVLDGL